MDDKNNPFDILKNLPHFDENFLRDITGMDWNNPAGVIKNLGRGKWPLLDIVETFNEIIVNVEIPGLKKADDVTVKVKGNTLIMEGEKFKDTRTSSDIRVHEQERQFGRFSRTVSLPASVDGKYARATYRQGVLEIRFTKLSDSQAETLKVKFFE